MYVSRSLKHGCPVVRLAEEGQPLDAEDLQLHVELAVDVSDVGVGHQRVDVSLGVGGYPLELVRVEEVDAEDGAPALAILGGGSAVWNEGFELRARLIRFSKLIILIKLSH